MADNELQTTNNTTKLSETDMQLIQMGAQMGYEVGKSVSDAAKHFIDSAAEVQKETIRGTVETQSNVIREGNARLHEALDSLNGDETATAEHKVEVFKEANRHDEQMLREAKQDSGFFSTIKKLFI